MNIEKVKEALEDCAGLFVLADGIQSFEDFEGGQPNLGTLRNLQAIKTASLKAQKALAELEKSAAHGPIYVPDAWEKEVDRIAEAYHAKKCAECKKTTPKCLLCGDPIYVGVCENCVPEIITDDGHFHSTDIVKFRKELNSDIDEIIKKEPEPPHA